MGSKAWWEQGVEDETTEEEFDAAVVEAEKQKAQPTVAQVMKAGIKLYPYISTTNEIVISDQGVGVVPPKATYIEILESEKWAVSKKLDDALAQLSAASKKAAAAIAALSGVVQHIKDGKTEQAADQAKQLYIMLTQINDLTRSN